MIDRGQRNTSDAGMSNEDEKRTFIALLASHDDVSKNNALARLIDMHYEERPDLLKQFRFVFTGGTFDRVIEGTERPRIQPVSEETKEFLFKDCGVIRLPSRTEGGVTILAYLIAQRKVSIIWPFLTPLTTHWLNPENLALIRLCDQWHVKKLMNTGSVTGWVKKEAGKDVRRNLQDWPPRLKLGGTKTTLGLNHYGDQCYKMVPPEAVLKESTQFPDLFTIKGRKNATVALIAHDEMKTRMLDFAVDYEQELSQFSHILTTGTTGRLVEEIAPSLEKLVYRYHSGPKGGDVEIATEVLFGKCHVVIFFVDPLHPHPHIEDIRVVFGACMIQDDVRMLSNEMQAREWIDTVVKGR